LLSLDMVNYHDFALIYTFYQSFDFDMNRH